MDDMILNRLHNVTAFIIKYNYIIFIYGYTCKGSNSHILHKTSWKHATSRNI